MSDRPPDAYVAVKLWQAFALDVGGLGIIGWLIHEGSLGTEAQIMGILTIGAIAGVHIWRRGNAAAGSAVVFLASWPLAKALTALGLSRYG